MTLFEYISVAFSLVLSLAAVRLLSGLSLALLEDGRFWVHGLWMLWVLGLSALVWWNFWSFREAEWTLFGFLLVLGPPGSIYLMGAALVPESPMNVHSWENHFFFARRRFFLPLAAFFVTISTASYVLLDVPWTNPARPVQGIACALAVVGALSPSRRLHRILPLVFWLMMVGISATLFVEPGSLTTEN